MFISILGNLLWKYYSKRSLVRSQNDKFSYCHLRAFTAQIDNYQTPFYLCYWAKSYFHSASFQLNFDKWTN